MGRIQIVIVRHGQKDGDKLTAKGAMQAFAAAEALAEKGFSFDRVLFSGAHRTHQTAQIMAAALGRFEQTPEEFRGLHFAFVFEKTHGSDRDGFFTEMDFVKEAGGDMKKALEISEYARMGRAFLEAALIDLAEEMAEMGETTALAASHSPWTELAAVDTNAMPYGLGEADAVCYTVFGGKIMSSELIKAPIEGQTLDQSGE